MAPFRLPLDIISRVVSMKSGLEDRNNVAKFVHHTVTDDGLNEVRPGRPEQSTTPLPLPYVSMKSGLDGRNNDLGRAYTAPLRIVSMESGLDGRNNAATRKGSTMPQWSQWSPA